MRISESLPAGYEQIFAVDLQKDKKMALSINLTAILIMLIMGVGMHFLIPVTALFTVEEDQIWLLFVRAAVLAVSYIAYIFLHEAVHGVAMKLCGTKKVKYGFTGLYAFAGSDAYYGKGAYIFIALAPVVLWGVVLGVLCALLPTGWFWIAWFLQIGNISGAAGDFYVTFRFLRMPREILVRDSGVSMTVFAPCDKKHDT